jgi:hypothetical protein
MATQVAVINSLGDVLRSATLVAGAASALAVTADELSGGFNKLRVSTDATCFIHRGKPPDSSVVAKRIHLAANAAHVFHDVKVGDEVMFT